MQYDTKMRWRLVGQYRSFCQRNNNNKATHVANNIMVPLLLVSYFLPSIQNVFLSLLGMGPLQCVMHIMYIMCTKNVQIFSNILKLKFHHPHVLQVSFNNNNNNNKIQKIVRHISAFPSHRWGGSCRRFWMNFFCSSRPTSTSLSNTVDKPKSNRDFTASLDFLTHAEPWIAPTWQQKHHQTRNEFNYVNRRGVPFC